MTASQYDLHYHFGICAAYGTWPGEDRDGHIARIQSQGAKVWGLCPLPAGHDGGHVQREDTNFLEFRAPLVVEGEFWKDAQR